MKKETLKLVYGALPNSKVGDITFILIGPYFHSMNSYRSEEGGFVGTLFFAFLWFMDPYVELINTPFLNQCSRDCALFFN